MDESAWQELARSVIARAVRAPSSHNTQPWRFLVTGCSIELHADRTRALPVNDPDDRELAISCGCALMNLRIAAAGEGTGLRVELLPEPGEPNLLARLSLSDQASVSEEEAQLAGFIERRRTYRKRFAPGEAEPVVIDRLAEAAGHEGAWLQPLQTEAGRQAAAELIAEGDAAQWADPNWRRELAAWMHPRRRGDGLTVPGLSAPLIRLMVRSFDMGRRVAAKDRQLARGAPLLAVLGTEHDGPRDWLLAGQALQRSLLVACANGLQASYLNQPLQVASLRPRLGELLGAGPPQILLRFGAPAEEISPAPRRSVDQVVDS